MPHQHGLTFNVENSVIRADTMMGQIFRDAGYSTGYSGKWHINVPQQDKARHGFEWMHNIRCNGADEGIAPDFERFLREKVDGPFIFSASFNNPHNICEAARGWPFPDGNPGMAENMNQLPPLPDNFSIPKREPSVIREVQDTYRSRNYPTADWDEMRWRLHRWYYCRVTEIVDRRIGELIQVLKQNGHWDDTVIVFTSDHGDGNAHHLWNQKQTLYDESARVPFIVMRPDSCMGRVDRKQLVNTGIDLIPTLCGLAGIESPSQLEGIDWSEILTNQDLPMKRDHVIVETEFGTYGKPFGCLGRAVRTARYKYMIYDRGENREFLVDMEDDPGETINLVGAERHHEELNRHRTLLRDYIVGTDDIFSVDAIPGSIGAKRYE
jgi:choline-sulfatase